MEVKNWYPVRLFRHNKILFCFVFLFVFFQLYFNRKRMHTFPWFVWDMYSRVDAMPDTITQTEFFMDGERLDITKVPIWEEATITHTYKMYNWQRMNNNNDPMDALVKSRTAHFPGSVYHYVADKINNHTEENQLYPAWMKKYLEERLHKKIKTVEVKDVQYKLVNGKFTDIHNSWTVLKIEN